MSNERPEFFSNLAGSAGARIVLLGFLVLVLQIPIAMIGRLAVEREQTRDQALAEIASTWGATQDVMGPFLIVP